jgi:hypothetical protein
MTEAIKAFPLQWPAGWKRTEAGARKHAQFYKSVYVENHGARLPPGPDPELAADAALPLLEAFLEAKNANAVLYLRSSKDRHDVSIEHQRHELAKLAADRGLAIVGEFRDVVESGKDDDRPGFQDLIEAARARPRLVDRPGPRHLAPRQAPRRAVKFEEESAGRAASRSSTRPCRKARRPSAR